MSETNTMALKETLFAQQQLLQKLYNELDAERDASSTAASEALSMILRLQGEKAAVKMEAEHYKRLAEEKMCHAEESMGIFEEILYQKEMEISALDFQVQAYRYKLRSLGCNDPGIFEVKANENWFQRNETLSGENSFRSITRRNSLPPIPLKPPSIKKVSIERERSESPETDLSVKIAEGHTIEGINDPNFGLEKKHSDSSTIGNINSYWDQIRKLKERVHELAGEECANLRSRSRSASPLSKVSSGMSDDSMKGTISNESVHNHPKALLENEVTNDSACFSSVHDVFEVPQTHEKAKYEGKSILQGNERSGKLDLFLNEAVKLHVNDQADCLDKMHLSTHRDEVHVDCHLAIVQPSIVVSESESNVQQLDRTSEIVEIHGQGLTHESTSRGEEEIKLVLNDIREQLNSIQSEIKSLKLKKPSRGETLPMLSLKEAMLHFWL